MIVVDGSLLATALVYADDRGRRARVALGRDPEWAAPEHWKMECFAAVRGLAVTDQIADAHAIRAIDRLHRLAVDQVPLDRLLPRMWQSRDALTTAQAAYVALAEARDLALVTCDPQLARAALAYCRVELVA